MDIKILRKLVFLALYFVACHAIVFFLPFDLFSVKDIQPISSVTFSVSDAESPSQIKNNQWEAIELPDFWSENHQDQHSIWYLAKFEITDIKQTNWAIYLPSVTHNAVLYLNDHWIGQGGEMSVPISRHHNEPLLFEFSNRLLHKGENTLLIRVVSESYYQGLLDQFYIAPSEQLKESYEWKKFARVDFIQWLSINMYIVMLALFIFWISRPQETVYGLFGLLLFFWSSHNLNLFVTEIPMSPLLWEAMTMSTLGWAVIAMIFFNHRYIGQINFRAEKLFLIFASIGLSAFLFPSISSLLIIGYKVWDTLLVLLGIYAIYYLLGVVRKDNNQDAFLMLLVGIPILVLGFHDILIVNHLIDRREGLIIQYGALPTLLLFSWFLIRRFLYSLKDAEQLTETLEQRVQQKQLALEEQYQQLNEFEKQTVLAQERERIMRDMHDGIGGQLISIVTVLSDHKEDVFVKIKEKIQHSISDLRFVIDSLDPLLNDISTLLGGMRLRLSEQLSDANMALEWQTTELPEMKALSPTHSLHIMRIVQEAVTNSIKHSNGKAVTIASGVLYDSDKSEKKTHVFIDVSDNGLGLKERKEDELLGRGITNMAYRAKQLEGILTILPVNSGTTVRLTIPLLID